MHFTQRQVLITPLCSERRAFSSVVQLHSFPYFVYHLSSFNKKRLTEPCVIDLPYRILLLSSNRTFSSKPRLLVGCDSNLIHHSFSVLQASTPTIPTSKPRLFFHLHANLYTISVLSLPSDAVEEYECLFRNKISTSVLQSRTGRCLFAEEVFDNAVLSNCSQSGNTLFIIHDLNAPE